MAMHEGEIRTDARLVRELLSAQFPDWAELPITAVSSFGTDHDIYRLGEDLAVRLPRIGWATGQASTEARWLPVFAPRLPLAVPAYVGHGHATETYPYDWSVCTWLPGRSAADGLDDLDRAAEDLAGFVVALRGIDTSGSHPREHGQRASPLTELDEAVREWTDVLGDRGDRRAILRAWEEALTAPAYDGPGRWAHGDLLPGNLLVVGDRLSAVIDWGGLNVGDPAVDLQPAWNLFAGASRERYRAALGTDEATWLRGRGWTVFQTVAALAYYWDTNPGIVAQAARALDAVLTE
jgi:aminoglycoside phosphotransferase (APT) family kinase protein